MVIVDLRVLHHATLTELLGRTHFRALELESILRLKVLGPVDARQHAPEPLAIQRRHRFQVAVERLHLERVGEVLALLCGKAGLVDHHWQQGNLGPVEVDRMLVLERRAIPASLGAQRDAQVDLAHMTGGVVARHVQVAFLGLQLLIIIFTRRDSSCRAAAGAAVRRRLREPTAFQQPAVAGSSRGRRGRGGRRGGRGLGGLPSTPFRRRVRLEAEGIQSRARARPLGHAQSVVPRVLEVTLLAPVLRAGRLQLPVR
mmetsp:Transcript_87764/g.253443  ORF Transcript_87764/g.253443 Transcript_87764/m.253443 type:complete len:257 (+) Transcript_87764:1717-2487(+)